MNNKANRSLGGQRLERAEVEVTLYDEDGDPAINVRSDLGSIVICTAAMDGKDVLIDKWDQAIELSMDEARMFVKALQTVIPA